MNKKRKKRIEEILTKLNSVIDGLKEVREEEKDAKSEFESDDYDEDDCEDDDYAESFSNFDEDIEVLNSAIDTLETEYDELGRFN